WTPSKRATTGPQTFLPHDSPSQSHAERTSFEQPSVAAAGPKQQEAGHVAVPGFRPEHSGWLAEGVGFEPTVGCPTHALQACRFGRSRIPPGVTVPSVFRPPLGAVAGSCATGTREPSQGRKAAALSGPSRVPQSSLAAAPNGGP